MLCLAQILSDINEIDSLQDRVAALRKHYHFAMKQVIQFCFLPEIKWLLPEGEVPYTPSKVKGMDNYFYAEAKKLYLFVKGGNDNLSQIKREFLFIQLLESIDPRDAKMLESIKDKNWPFKRLTRRVLHEAFPGMIP